MQVQKGKKKERGKTKQTTTKRGNGSNKEKDP